MTDHDLKGKIEQACKQGPQAKVKRDTGGRAGLGVVGNGNGEN
jgi:hypothetical protein